MNGAKILVLGAGGRLGAALVREWQAQGLTRAELDLGNAAAVRSAVVASGAEVVVNCAALTNVDYCETHPADAHRINGEAVRGLAEACAAAGARCAHISTDYVFNGAKTSPYTEHDLPQPISHYGASKLAGEAAVLAAGGEHLVVRVSWVFGPDRASFVDQILARARVEESVAAIADKWSTPTYTRDAARYLGALLKSGAGGGVYHLANAGACTWQEYGQWALDCAREAGVGLKAQTVAPLTMAELTAFVAKRPPYTVLGCGKLAGAIGEEPREWKDAVQEYVQAWALGL